MRAAGWMRTLLLGTLAAMVAACASIGRPEGGPRDTTPPEFVRSTPPDGALNVDRKKIDLIFNENIKLEDAMNKLIVSPTQKQQPVIRSNGKHVSVELRDTLLPNTTYTLDFADAIRDLNEGNILDGFATAFSTGDHLDTLQISGMVFQASNLEPAQGMIVGVYSNLSDTALTTLPLERVAKTNQLGQFTIRNLPEGTYRIFALEDQNRDWHWDRSENIAFADFDITPSVVPVEVADTLRDSQGGDSIVTRTAWRYLPDDLLLTWFNENYKPYYLRDYERTDRKRVTFKFGAPMDDIPQVRILNGPLEGELLSEHSAIETRQPLDSIVFWMREPELLAADSLLLAATYLKNDSLDRPVAVTDTLKFFVRSADRRMEEEARKKWEKKIEEWEKKAAEPGGDTIPRPEELPLPLTIKALTQRQQELNQPVRFEFGEPLESIANPPLWRLEQQIDTLWKEVAGARLSPDPAALRIYQLTPGKLPWPEGTKYRFAADSAAFASIYDTFNSSYNFEFETKRSEDYGSITLDISGIDAIPDSALLVVELLNSSDSPVATEVAKNGSATFRYIQPGTYYARAIIDLDADTLFTTGRIDLKQQPEEVYYYPKPLNLRRNWDIAQDWNLTETALDLQKPAAIKKNKPKGKDKPDSSGDEEDYEDEEGFGGSGFLEDDAWGNGSQYNNAGRGNNRRSGGNRNSNLKRNTRN